MSERTSLSVGASRALLALLLAGAYAPIGAVFVYSFNDARSGAVWTGFSTRWYATLFQRPELWAGLKVSILVGLAASTTSVFLGTCAALGLRRWRPASRQAARGLLGLPLVAPDIILAVALALFFHALRFERGLGTVVVAHTVFGLSYAYVVIAAAVEDFDESLYLAALDCGATPWQAFWRVIAPILSPSLAVAWLLVFAISFDDFLITFFTKGTGNDTLPIKIYSRMRFGVQPDTNALFVMLFLFTLGGAIGAALLLRRRER